MIQYGAFYAVALIFGYLLGSIPFGLILTRLAGLGDIRAIGSGNIGATNVLRTGNKGVAAATLILDALKGTAAVLLAAGAAQELGPIAGFGAFIGHIFPVWLNFRGGKGVSTYIGVLAALSWIAALAFAAVWLAMAAITRYSSAGGLIASLVAPAVAWFTAGPTVAVTLAVMTIILWWRHEANIRRLIAGTEGRIGERQ